MYQAIDNINNIDNNEEISDKIIIPDKFNTGAKGKLEAVPQADYIGNEEASIVFKWRDTDTYSVNVAPMVQENVVVENKKFDYAINFLNEGSHNGQIKIKFKNCSFKKIGSGRRGLDNVEFIFENCSFENAFGSNLSFYNCYFGGNISDGLNPFQNVKVYNCFFSDFAKSSETSAEIPLHTDGTQIYAYSRTERRRASKT